jgi:hypothetical protein
VLTEREDHLVHLHQKLKGFGRHIVVIRGGQSVKERCEIQEQLASIPAEEERLLLATGRYIGEGFDDARLDTPFLTLPGFVERNTRALRRTMAPAASRRLSENRLIYCGRA